MPDPRTFSSEQTIWSKLSNFWRVFLLALTLAAAYFAATVSVAAIFDTAQPALVLRVYGNAPGSIARMADLEIASATAQIQSARSSDAPPQSMQDMANAMSPATIQRIRRLALLGIREAPLNSPALRQLAYLETDEAKRTDLLLLGKEVSRRDVGVAAQLAEIQVLGGDARAAFANLNRALVVSDALDAQMFPLLLQASTDKEAERLLRELLAKDPIWAERFARHATANETSGALFARLVDSLPEKSRARSADYGQQLIDRLATVGQYSDAFRAYRAYSASAQDFSAFGNQAFPPIDWRLIDNLESGARLLDIAGPVSEIFVNAGRQGQVAQILTRLDPGNYALQFTLDDLQGSGGTLELTRVCLKDAEELSVASDQTPFVEGLVNLGFTVPANCPYQSLRLRALAGNQSTNALLSKVTLRRAGRPAARSAQNYRVADGSD